MKVVAAAMLGGLMVFAGPALAQDKNKDMSNMSGKSGMSDTSGMSGSGMSGMQDKSDAPMHHMSRVRYKRDYKTDREEMEQTEALNRQYRGVNMSDMH